MNKYFVIAIFSIILAWPNITRAVQDCGQDIRCFEKATEFCQPATLTTSSTVAQGGSGILVSSVVDHTIIGPLDNSFCNYHFVVKKLGLEFDPHLMTMRQEANDSVWLKNWKAVVNKSIQYENMEADCKIPLGTQLLLSSAYWEIQNLGLDAENAFGLQKICTGTVMDYYIAMHQKRLAESRDYDREFALTHLQTLLNKYYEVNQRYPVAHEAILGKDNYVSLDINSGFGKGITTSCFDCFDDRNFALNPADKFTYASNGRTFLVAGNLETEADWLHAMTQKDMKEGPIYLTPAGIDQEPHDQAKFNTLSKYYTMIDWLWWEFVFPFINAWHFIQRMIKDLINK